MIVRRSLIAGGIAAAMALFAGIAGCGGSSGGSGTGTLRVAMVDAPDPTVTAVNITVDRVEAHVNGGWTPISVTPQSFDLLDLVQNKAILGTASLPTGHYNQIRLFVSNATVTDASGTHPVTIPSSVQTGIKVNVNYAINADEITEILLDFNVQKSIHKTGAGVYMMNPVIPAVVTVLSGAVTGTVTDGGAPFHGATLTATYTAGSAYPLGTVVNTNMSLEDGTFKIWALLPGTYTITATYTDPVTSAVKTASVTTIVVQAGQSVSVGSLELE